MSLVHVPPVVPPLEDEDEPRDEGGRAGEGHVELGRQRGEEHGGHAHVLADLERPAQVEDHERYLKESKESKLLNRRSAL